MRIIFNILCTAVGERGAKQLSIAFFAYIDLTLINSEG